MELLYQSIPPISSLLLKKLLFTIDSCFAKEKAVYYKDNVLVSMSELRERVDALESMTSAKYWPYPSYGELLFGIK